MAHAALGAPQYDRKGIGGANAQFRRSLYVVADVRAGERFTEANLRSIRPGLGLAPRHLPDVLGATATRDIAYGEPLDWSMVRA